MSARTDFYARNYTVVASNTPVNIGGGTAVHIKKVVVTGTITGTVTVADSAVSAATPLLFSATTPAIGTIFELDLRTKYGCWVVPGTGGTLCVYWD